MYVWFKGFGGFRLLIFSFLCVLINYFVRCVVLKSVRGGEVIMLIFFFGYVSSSSML